MSREVVMMEPRWQLAASGIILIVCVIALIAYGDVALGAILDPAHAKSGDWMRLAAIVATGVFSIIAAWDAYRALKRAGRSSEGK